MPLVYISIVCALHTHGDGLPHQHDAFKADVVSLDDAHQVHLDRVRRWPVDDHSLFLIIRKNTKLKIGDEAFDILSQIVTYCLGIALFLTLSEVVTELYLDRAFVSPSTSVRKARAYGACPLVLVLDNLHGGGLRHFTDTQIQEGHGFYLPLRASLHSSASG
jgi:hypothetical protein